MRRINADVDFGSRSVAEVAATFLGQHEAELKARASGGDAQ